MTQCKHEDCTEPVLGTIKWDTIPTVEKEYCRKHITTATEQLGEFIMGVEIV